MMYLKTVKTKRKKSKRMTDERHLDFIRSLPCLICGADSEAHHLLRVPEKGMGRKADDSHTVPLCRTHHRGLHDSGDETGYLGHAVELSEQLYGRSGSWDACMSLIEDWRHTERRK